MDCASEVAALREQLTAAAVPGRAEQEKRYLRSNLTFIGAPVPAIRRAAVRWASEHPNLDRGELIELVDALWATRVHELRSTAIALLERRRSLLLAEDLTTIERLLRDAGTWAHVDWLSTAVVGFLMEKFPELRRALPVWIRDEDFWIRRASLLALLVPLREGRGDFALFRRLAEPRLEETEFFIRKAIGWVLRETAKKRPALVAEFLRDNAGRVSGLTFREAARGLPEELRASLTHAPSSARRRASTRSAP